MGKSSKNSTRPEEYDKFRPAELATLLEEWALRDDVYMISQFYIPRHIPKTTFYDHVRNNKKLNTVHQIAKEKCGINRFLKGMHDSMNSVIAFPLSQYLDDYKEEHKFRAKLKEDNNGKTLKPEEYEEILSRVLKTETQKRNEDTSRNTNKT